VPEIEPWLERAALVLAPLRIGGGMRMKVLQAMAMGKAVVTTSRGAAGLAAGGQAPPLAVADDVEGMVAAAAALLADPAGRQALGRQARAHVTQHFSPQAHVRRLESIYARLLAPQRRQPEEIASALD
jgi:glycosyltransferase involved in cell wall biosynthesis